jgi:uncharacterized membrane protein YjjP (DUF1212 family)
MSRADARQQESERETLDLIGGIAGLLFAHGQTTEAVRLAAERLGAALGQPVRLTARWGELGIWRASGAFGCHQVAEPVAVDIGRVLAAEHLADDWRAGHIGVAAVHTGLAEIAARPPVGLPRFAVMAACGAAALAIIFGASDALTVALVAASAGAGAALRRAASRLTGNAFVQPFLAAFLAGAVASLAVTLRLPVSLRLVAVCPCMVLVPGPHFLNGMMDLARSRLPLGASRVGFASLIALAISAGLLLGLSLATATLPAAAQAAPVPLAWDVAAAGVAVAAYASFFNMPWRSVPIPIAVGMAAHALRWQLLALGASLQLGAFVACLLVGTVMTLAARRLRMPFGALAFASVVSLIPGLFMFQVASEALGLVDHGTRVSLDTLTALLRDGATAIVVLLAMAAGLIVPRVVADMRRHAGPGGH